MSNLPEHLGYGGASGIVGVILGWLGFRHRVKAVEQDIKGMKARVRFSDVCEQIVKRVESRLKSIEEVRLKGIEEMQEEVRKDIKELLKRNGAKRSPPQI